MKKDKEKAYNIEYFHLLSWCNLKCNLWPCCLTDLQYFVERYCDILTKRQEQAFIYSCVDFRELPLSSKSCRKHAFWIHITRYCWPVQVPSVSRSFFSRRLLQEYRVTHLDWIYAWNIYLCTELNHFVKLSRKERSTTWWNS